MVRDMDVTIYRDISCDITHPRSPRKPGANLNSRKTHHLVAVYSSCFFRLCLCPHLGYVRLAFFVVLLLSISWTHHRTDRITSKQHPVAKKRYEAVGFPCNRMLKLSSSRGIRIDVPVLSVSWSFVDHSVIIKALRKGLIEHEARDTGGVPCWKSSCPDRLAEDTISRYFSELYWRSLAEELAAAVGYSKLGRYSE